MCQQIQYIIKLITRNINAWVANLKFPSLPFVNSYPGSSRPHTSHTMHIPPGPEWPVARIDAQPSSFQFPQFRTIFISMGPQPVFNSIQWARSPTTFSTNHITKCIPNIQYNLKILFPPPSSFSIHYSWLVCKENNMFIPKIWVTIPNLTHHQNMYIRAKISSNIYIQ